MRTILVGECSDERTYLMSDPDAPQENEFEFSVGKALACAYPNYSCVVFGGTFRHNNRLFRPDLALVAKNFSHWFIIEMELVSHSFDRHVLPQVLALRYGDPQVDCLNVLARELEITPARAGTLLSQVPRSVAVVANKRDDRWQIALSAHGVQMLAVSVYRSMLGAEAIEVEGVLEVLEENLGFGTYSSTDRSLRFPSTVNLPAGSIQINDPDGGLSSWTVTRDRGTTWVTKDYGSPSIANSTYVQLIRTVGGRLSLRRPE